MTDDELVKLAKLGDIRAFSDLFKRHREMILCSVFRFTKCWVLAEDVTQMAFVRAIEKINQFEGRCAFSSWLFQIATNYAKNALRDKKSTCNIDDVEIGVDPDLENEMLSREILLMAAPHISRLPYSQRRAFIMRVCDGLTFAEIAQEMGCAYDTAKSNYRWAMLRLRDELKHRTEYKNYSKTTKDIFVVGAKDGE